MIGIVLITHGQIGHELRAAVENMLGPQKQIETVSVVAGTKVEAMRSSMNRAVDAVAGKGEGVLILADMFGGTPCNLAAKIASSDAVSVVTGVNLPMLVKAIEARQHSSLSHVAQAALEAGRHYIGYANAPKTPEKAAEWERS